MTNTNQTAAQLAAENMADAKFMGDNILVTCSCGDVKEAFRDRVSHPQYVEAKERVFTELCPHCQGRLRCAKNA